MHVPPPPPEHSQKFETLREEAERLIQSRPRSCSDASPDILELIHELRIHQAELEIQNEELRRAQQELADLHREYENLYEFAPCGYLTLNSNGIVTHINLTGARLLGADRRHIMRQGLSGFMDSGWADLLVSARMECAKTGETQSLELPLKTESGRSPWVRADIEADRDESGAALQWRIVLLDISEKKKAMAALERSEAKYRKMMESITDALYVCSPERTIEYMNPAMIQRVGRDATGEQCFKAIHGSDAVCEWCPFENVFRGETIDETIESPLDDRTYRVASMPVLNADRSVSKLTIYRDITDYLTAVAEKAKAEAKLRQARKMESIGHLAGGIAHNFNNVLACIIGFTELSLDDVEKGSDLEGNLHEIYAAGKRARDLVVQILTFARKTNEAVEPVDIANITRESLKFIRSSIPADIEIEQRIDTNALVVGNPSLLQQVFLNLASNAADAMEDDGGVLKIAVSDIVADEGFASDHDLLRPGDHVRITVSDTGVGIPPDAVESIFEPYFTTKEVGKGTGMGLATVYGIVKKYGGAIHVDSRLGRGTVFTVLLPSTKKRETAEPDRSKALPKGEERILFVDDELPIAKMCHQMLERLGYSVTCRTCGTDALELFKADPDAFDLVVTDMTMPHLTGDKLAVELMKIRPDIPVILCTGYSKKISDEIAAEIGIRAFAHKPMVQADLAETVRKVLDEAKR